MGRHGMVKSRLVNILKLIISLVACLAAGGIGSIFTTPSIGGWYAGLVKPSFTPPNWLFGPAWTVLYILMGISLYLVVIRGWENETVKTGIILFAAQLVVNLLWSIIFFGLHSPLGGLACIFVLLALIVATIITFYRLSKPAAVLLIPYLAWVCIATALNAGVVLLN